MSREMWRLIPSGVLLLCLVAITACQRTRPTPTPQSSPAPTPAAVSGEGATPEAAQPAARPATPTAPSYRILGSDTAPTTLVNALVGYTLTLPAGWRVLDLPLHGVDDAVQQIAANPQTLAQADAATTFLRYDGSDHIEVVARHIGADLSETTLTLMVILRQGLSLESYLSEFVERLADADEAYNLGEETVDHKLRADHMPVGLLHYAPASPDAHRRYAHAVLLAPTGEHLIALTIAMTDVPEDSVTNVVQEMVTALQLQWD